MNKLEGNNLIGLANGGKRARLFGWLSEHAKQSERISS